MTQPDPPHDDRARINTYRSPELATALRLLVNGDEAPTTPTEVTFERVHEADGHHGEKVPPAPM